MLLVRLHSRTAQRQLIDVNLHVSVDILQLFDLVVAVVVVLHLFE